MRNRKTNKATLLLTAIGLGITCGAQSSFADDGGISFGGSPHLLSGHASVSMKSEVVRMDIRGDKIKVDCQFVFHNSSPKPATVRVGFPDEGLGAEEPYQGGPLPPLSKLKATFITYESYVDGKKVPTKLVPTKDRALFWHTKMVTFPGNKDLNVRDVYTLKAGGQMTNENGFYKQTSYILHTGSSWHGPIGRADIIITLDSEALNHPILLKSLKSIPGKNPEDLVWSKEPKGTLIWDGPCTPQMKDRTLTFSTTNLKPKLSDDIRLFYNWKRVENTP